MRVPLLHFVIFHGYGQGPLAADQDHEFLPTGDCCVYEISLEHNVVLGKQGNDHAGIFGALRFMYGYGVGQHELIEIRVKAPTA